MDVHFVFTPAARAILNGVQFRTRIRSEAGAYPCVGDHVTLPGLQSHLFLVISREWLMTEESLPSLMIGLDLVSTERPQSRLSIVPSSSEATGDGSRSTRGE